MRNNFKEGWKAGLEKVRYFIKSPSEYDKVLPGLTPAVVAATLALFAGYQAVHVALPRKAETGVLRLNDVGPAVAELNQQLANTPCGTKKPDTGWDSNKFNAWTRQAVICTEIASGQTPDHGQAGPAVRAVLKQPLTTELYNTMEKTRQAQESGKLPVE